MSRRRLLVRCPSSPDVGLRGRRYPRCVVRRSRVEERVVLPLCSIVLRKVDFHFGVSYEVQRTPGMLNQSRNFFMCRRVLRPGRGLRWHRPRDLSGDYRFGPPWKEVSGPTRVFREEPPPTRVQLTAFGFPSGATPRPLRTPLTFGRGADLSSPTAGPLDRSLKRRNITRC